MHWFVHIVLCTILLTIVISNPIKKHSSKHKKTKHTAVHKIVHSKVIAPESKADAFKFLTQFGYNRCENPLGSESNDHGSPLCQSSMESMLEDFQTAFHLPVTKKLDATTLNLMNTPRCSLPDSPASSIDKSKLW